MKSNETRLTIIKDTVKNSIIVEMRKELNEKIADKEKVKELIDMTNSKLSTVINSMNEREFLPTKELKSPEDLQNHILDVIKKVKSKLSDEMKKEENNL